MCCNVYCIHFAFYVIISFVFLLLIAGSVSAYSESRINAEAIDFNSKLGSANLDSHIEKRDDSSTDTAWFGPRLGRKKRSAKGGSHDTYSRVFGSQPRVLALYLDDEILSVSDDRWTDSHHRLQKRSTSSDDDISDSSSERSKLEYYILQLLEHYPRLLDIFRNENLADSDDQLAKPRYGRGNTWPDEEKMVLRTPPFSPRLGRRSQLPLKMRLGRAGKDAEVSAVFKPRLGRDPNMNDFSEYGEVQNGIEDKDH